ncbi:hypothetical protein [Lentzea sp. NBRC 105346]|uniref:hypothetical protein n=1 Tax=Lentzea sp. NBRC 105346 TaxID=3032205 RepID=UPI00255712D2|nr:hypothetical protein [Lentzea sp. NBRC 105346]
MPPTPPPMVDQIIPRTLALLAERQNEIERLGSMRTPITAPHLVQTLDLCKQLLETRDQ